MKRLAVGVVLWVAACGSEPHSDLDVVYGSDDRRDVYKVQDAKLAELAKSTAILIPNDVFKDPNAKEDEQENDGPEAVNFVLDLFLNKNKSTENNSSEHQSTEEATGPVLPLPSVEAERPHTPIVWDLDAASIGEDKNLCEDEPFREQPSPGICSGFLIAPDLLATAGHCVNQGCGSFKVVFNYFYDQPASEKNLWQVHEDDVYECAEVVGSYVDKATSLDFGVIRLDRPVKGVNPVTLRSSGKIKAGTPLAVIGYPMGMPGKVIEGGNTESTQTDNRYYFVGTLDTYGGNSGSAVFNARTYEVEGILVRGEDDLVKTPEGCFRSNFCRDRRCRGEDVNRIATLKQFLDTMPNADTVTESLTYQEKHLELELPDGDRHGVEVTFRVKEDAKLVDAKVQVDLLHPNPNQVSAKLIHPEGFTINLGTGGARRHYDLKASYEFLHLRGLSAAGLWRLVLADESEGRTGYVDAAHLTLVVESDGTSSEPVPQTASVESQFEGGIAVPDKGAGELTLALPSITATGEVASVALTVEIEHPYVSDLTITLVSPTGVEFDVFAGGRGSSADLALTFGLTGEDVPGFQEAFVGSNVTGQWQVRVADHGSGDTGAIHLLKLDVALANEL